MDIPLPQAIQENAEFIGDEGDLLKLFIFWYLYMNHFRLIFEEKVYEPLDLIKESTISICAECFHEDGRRFTLHLVPNSTTLKIRIEKVLDTKSAKSTSQIDLDYSKYVIDKSHVKDPTEISKKLDQMIESVCNEK